MLHLVARRHGEMWLHPMGETLVLSAGVELVPLEPGAPIRLDPQRLRGLEPPYDPGYRWTVRWAAGSWPTAVFLVDHQFIGCTNGVEGAYHWTPSGWRRLNPQEGLDVSARFVELVSFGGGALARREHVLADSTRFDDQCEDAPMPEGLARQLTEARRGDGIVTLGAEGKPSRGPQVPLRDAVAAPDGSVHVVHDGALVRWDPSGSRVEVPLPEQALGRGATVSHAVGSHAYVHVDDELVHFDGQGWTAIELPPRLDLLASAGGDGGPLWVSGRDTGAEDRSDWPLWEFDGTAWTHHALPLVTFDGVAPTESPLDVWQIHITEPGVMWLLAYHPHGGPGSSALLSTVPVSEAVLVPGYEGQWRDALDANPKAKARIEAAGAR